LWLSRLGRIRLSKRRLVPEESSSSLLSLALGGLLLLRSEQTEATASGRLLLGGLTKYGWLLTTGVCICAR
jgi:hypothetical protein